MKTLQRNQAAELWNKYWDQMSDEWFKVEVLQDYSGEDEGPSLNAWLAGEKEKALRLMKATDYSEWIDHCQKKLRQGVKLKRFHLLEEPYTPYVDWELQHYKYVNIPKCGEEVHLLNRLELAEADLPPGDFMIFDNKRVVVNTYNERGLMTHQTFYDQNDDITRFLELQKNIIKLAEAV